MRAICFDPASDRFAAADLPTPQLSEPWQVRVVVDWVGLNPVDAKMPLWKGMVPGMDKRFVGGLDVSGRVLEVGSGVTDWKVGDRVLYHGNMRLPHGGFAQEAIADSRTLVPHPNIDGALAAATPCAGWTAYRALVDKLRAGRKHSLLILGASGGVGSFALQLARHLGVNQVIAVCSAPNHDFVRSLGATHTVDYRTHDVLEAVEAITQGVGVEAAFDCVGGPNAALAADALAFDGQACELVDVWDPSEARDPFGRSLTFHQLSLGGGYAAGPRGRASIRTAGLAFTELLAPGIIEVPKLQVVAFDAISDALDRIRGQRTVGKIVAHMDR